MPARTAPIDDQLDAATEKFYRRPVPGKRMHVRPRRPMTAAGLEAFCGRHPEAVVELEPDGTITLSCFLTSLDSLKGSTFSYALHDHCRRSGGGQSFGPTLGLALPDGSIRSADASYVGGRPPALLIAERDDTYPEIAPDFVVEFVTKGMDPDSLKRRMRDTWLANGVRLGWLLWPKRRRAFVYAAGGEMREVTEWPSVLDASPVVEGFRFDTGLLMR